MHPEEAACQRCSTHLLVIYSIIGPVHNCGHVHGRIAAQRGFHPTRHHSTGWFKVLPAPLSPGCHPVLGFLQDETTTGLHSSVHACATLQLTRPKRNEYGVVDEILPQPIRRLHVSVLRCGTSAHGTCHVEVARQAPVTCVRCDVHAAYSGDVPRRALPRPAEVTPPPDPAPVLALVLAFP